MTQTVELREDERRLAELGCGLLPIVGVWWSARARHTFEGPIRNVELDEGAGIP